MNSDDLNSLLEAIKTSKIAMWNADHRMRRIDLADANLSQQNLSGADLSDAVLTRTNFSEAMLDGCLLQSADLREATLNKASLRQSDLSSANLKSARMQDAYLRFAALDDANLIRAQLTGANLSDASLRRTALMDANFSNADLRRADVAGANFSDATLDGADLRGANIREAFGISRRAARVAVVSPRDLDKTPQLKRELGPLSRLFVTAGLVILPAVLLYLLFELYPYSRVAQIQATTVYLFGRATTLSPEARLVFVVIIASLLGGYIAIARGFAIRKDLTGTWVAQSIVRLISSGAIGSISYFLVRAVVLLPTASVELINTVGITLAAVAVGLVAENATDYLNQIYSVLLAPEARATQVEKRIGDSLAEQMQTLILGPTLDRYVGVVCATVSTPEGRILELDAKGYSALPSPEGIVTVWFQSVPQKETYSEVVSIEEGRVVSRVDFDITVESDTIEFSAERRTLAVQEDQRSDNALFHFKIPVFTGTHTAWVRVSQKGKIVQVVTISIITQVPSQSVDRLLE
jgi:uncharacterized protein YjbI with pentapeptide repeats